VHQWWQESCNGAISTWTYQLKNFRNLERMFTLRSETRILSRVNHLVMPMLLLDYLLQEDLAKSVSSLCLEV